MSIGRIEQLTHTPGPWEVLTLDGRLPVVREQTRPHGEASTYSSTIRALSGRGVCVLDFGYGQKARNVDEANARLIATTPEQLALLKRYLNNHCANADAEGMSTLCECTLCLDTRAVIAKAEGR